MPTKSAWSEEGEETQGSSGWGDKEKEMKDRNVWRRGERKRGREESEAISVSAAPALPRRQRSHSESALGLCQYIGAQFQ